MGILQILQRHGFMWAARFVCAFCVLPVPWQINMEVSPRERVTGSFTRAPRPWTATTISCLLTHLLSLRPSPSNQRRRLLARNNETRWEKIGLNFCFPAAFSAWWVAARSVAVDNNTPLRDCVLKKTNVHLCPPESRVRIIIKLTRKWLCLWMKFNVQLSLYFKTTHGTKKM